jgi:hypothetical protein
MVRQRMGLLDEAIREHLELKRLGGADPGQVARNEHEAFGVVRDREAPDGADTGIGATFGGLGQETVELDMAAVLYADADAREPWAGVGGSPGRVPDSAAKLPPAIPGQERFGFG